MQEAEGILWCRGHWGSTKGQNCSSEGFGSWHHPGREHQHPPDLLLVTESTADSISPEQSSKGQMCRNAKINSMCSSAGLLCHIKAGKTQQSQTRALAMDLFSPAALLWQPAGNCLWGKGLNAHAADFPKLLGESLLPFFYMTLLLKTNRPEQ